MNKLMPLRNTSVANRSEPSPVAVAREIKAMDEVRAVVVRHYVRSSFDYWNNFECEEAKAAIPEANAWVTSAAYQEAVVEADRAVEPADTAFIAAELKMFTGAWPNASRGDLASYAALLAIDIQSLAPSRYGLAAALRKLRQTAKWLPSIAETLEVLAEMEERIRKVPGYLSELPRRIEDSRKQLERVEMRKKGIEEPGFERALFDKMQAKLPPAPESDDDPAF